MSIDLNWDTLTGGPDGAELAEHIRDFIHTKFQDVPLPKFLKSVTVHEFEFGSIAPQVVLKDICDPLPDFYEENMQADELDEDEDGEGIEDEGASDGGSKGGGNGSRDERDERDDDEDNVRARSGMGLGRGDDGVPDAIKAAERRRWAEQRRRLGIGDSYGSRPVTPGSGVGLPPQIHTAGLRSAPGTPGIPGGMNSMYFPSHFGPGWSGAQTPLAAVAGAQHLNGWLETGTGGYHHQQRRERHPSPSLGRSSFPASASPHRSEHHRNSSHSSAGVSDFQLSLTQQQALREKHSVSTLAPTSAGNSAGTSRPPTRDKMAGAGSYFLKGSAIDEGEDRRQTSPEAAKARGQEESDELDGASGAKYREPRVEDMQAVFRIKYSGDVKLMLTAEILLDYPMPSFVGIPVKLIITGLSFDGVGVVAYIRKRVHFCFLNPEDALAAIGDDDDNDVDETQESGGGRQQQGANDKGAAPVRSKMGGLLQEIKVESEIGQREGTKQSLKNVGKVERFVLEQVRRIFEEEFVYPSFWTFLV